MKRFGLRLTTAVVMVFAGIALLSTTYQDLFMHGIWMIDTELNEAGENSFFVRTKVDFGEGNYMESLPNDIDDWYGAGDYDWEHIKKALGADAMLVRAYTKKTNFEVVFFLVAQSDDPSSFHPPPVCFRAQGYNIEEEGSIRFTVPETEWAANHWRSELEGNVFKGSFSAKTMVITKEDREGNVTERMAVLYYYVKHGGVVPDNITMVQTSAAVPNDQAYDRTYDMLKELMGDMMPVLFEPEIIDKETTAAHVVGQFGVYGYLMIIGAFMVPIAVAFFPVRILRIRRKGRPPA